ncbi:MAG: sugar ABC transporter ATP-binding protein, partial [Sedimentisphaerales bacterium]|nr:sugar ABC transporter ATP-binding protein [Sedimentisphaerales bacterium]
MSENILEFINISKTYFGVHALRNVSLALKKGHILGLIGENGAGKSTLMNILGGVVLPDQGGMKLEGGDYAPRNPAAATEVGVAFIHQELNLFTNLSIADNIFIDRFPRISGLPFINRRKIHSKTRALLKSVDLNLSPNILVEKLSPGERQLVEIAKALNTGSKIIIFDEPTTSLTVQDTRRLFTLIEKLRTNGKSVIYISHTLSDVLRLADDIAVLRDGEVVVVGGKSEFSVNKMISRMVGREIEQFYPTRSTAPAVETVLEVKELSQSGIVKDIELDLHKG